ncbi:MAG: CPBP family intramembrane metalloprotease [Planctomycetia bacterium]|nr:CPBP family intramembrane metalloprotease [Planctomycetia bacterium]
MRDGSSFRKKFRWLRETWSLFTSDRPQRRVTVAILSATALLLTWKYFGTHTFFAAHAGSVIPVISDRDDVALQTCAELYRFGSFAILCGVLPWLMIRFLYREPLAEYGLTSGPTRRHRRNTWRSVLVLTPVFILIGALSALDPSLRAEFPFNRYAGDSIGLSVIHAAGYLVFYVAWEFFFRGFLQRTLSVSCGVATAILIQTSLSSMVHIGGPASETFSAIGGGLLWGVCVWRTGSILPGLAMHACMGLALDTAICLTRTGPL